MATQGIGTHEDLYRWMNVVHWDKHEKIQKTSRASFEDRLARKIRRMWRPGTKYNSAAVVMVDFSVENNITLHVYEKAPGDPSDIKTGTNRELQREQKMWGHVKVSEEFGTKIRTFELIRDPNHLYSVFSSNHIESITFRTKLKNMEVIKWYYNEKSPIFTARLAALM
ncbi:hypothetical protein [Pseudomonas asiatica]|uniref:hypothetical protein n=1 Tax=Pseudomonas asiatica TaxID=2219225 RepID=UPI0010BFF2BD|nr:hypothetical protein [Pseudomonas asiatica]